MKRIPMKITLDIKRIFKQFEILTVIPIVVLILIVLCYSCYRIDGGVSANDFVLQLLADLTGLDVERATTTEMSILGVAFLAGLQCGM